MEEPESQPTFPVPEPRGMKPWLVVAVTSAVTIPLSVVATWLVVRGNPDASPNSVPIATETTLKAPSSEVVSDTTPAARVVTAPDYARVSASWASGFEKVVSTDLNGDGADEIALGSTALSFFDANGRFLGRATGDGTIQLLEARAGDVFAAWGWTRATPVEHATITRHRLRDGGITSDIVTTVTETSRISAILPLADSLLVAWNVEKYVVGAFRARPGSGTSGWTLEPWIKDRTVAAYAVADFDQDGRDDLVIGRAYGDEVASDGDAWLVRATGDRIRIPTIRGVRAAAVADVDGDHIPEVVLADGWDKDYGKLARAQVRVARWNGSEMEGTFVDSSPGDFDVRRIIADDIDRDGRDEILTVTNSRVRVADWNDGRWTAWTLAEGVNDATVVHEPGGGTGILVIGVTPVILKAK